ncbi:hypothetical protein Agub_g1496, partial [Astrephomene gubernaculifera]
GGAGRRAGGVVALSRADGDRVGEEEEDMEEGEERREAAVAPSASAAAAVAEAAAAVVAAGGRLDDRIRVLVVGSGSNVRQGLRLLPLIREFARVVQRHYPGRLRSMYLADMPRGLRMGLGAVLNLLSVETRQKVKLCKIEDLPDCISGELLTREAALLLLQRHHPQHPHQPHPQQRQPHRLLSFLGPPTPPQSHPGHVINDDGDIADAGGWSDAAGGAGASSSRASGAPAAGGIAGRAWCALSSGLFHRRRRRQQQQEQQRQQQQQQQQYRPVAADTAGFAQGPDAAGFTAARAPLHAAAAAAAAPALPARLLHAVRLWVVRVVAAALMALMAAMACLTYKSLLARP